MTEKFLPRQNPFLYEINTAAWLFELSQKSGKTVRLGDVPVAEWDRLKDLGMDYIWLMGVWSRSQEGRKISLSDPEFHQLFDSVLPECQPEDIIGSCYSIGSYDVDPLVGTIQDVDRTRNELHRRNIGLILDFVPNHTGIDHQWLAEHPDYYIHVTRSEYIRDEQAYFAVPYKSETMYIAHGRDPYFPPWTDTAQLNYFNPAVREALLQQLNELSRHCDGLRCDMAMLVLNEVFKKTWGWANRDTGYEMPSEEFWAEVTRRLPQLVWIAEAYWDTEWTLQQLGFDYVYDKRLYDRLRHSPPHEIYLHLKADLSYQSKLLRFIENHDETRSITAFGKDMAEASAILLSGLPGMKLFFHGQLEGKKIRLPLQIRQSKPEIPDTDLSNFYSKLLAAANNDIFHAGSWKLVETFPDGGGNYDNIISYLLTWNARAVMVIVNLRPDPADCRITFQDDISEQAIYSFGSVLDSHSFTATGKTMAHPGLRFRMSGYQSQVYEIRPLEGQSQEL